jgi:maltose alpha-D-glucosyltransferase/alpha-amylase
VQKTTWSYHRESREYYFHRFYEFQPDLDTCHPEVRREILRVMGFWLQLGVSGFRMDAVPFLIEKKGARATHPKDYELLHQMRDFLQWRQGEAILLAEANVPPDESMEYFGDLGDRLQLMLNFPVNQRLFYALATGDITPLVTALQATYRRPQAAQWVNFLRSHDELDLGRLTTAQRQRVFDAFGKNKTDQLYNRGIRRRLAAMLDNDRRKIEFAMSLLFTLPGTPMIQYGDEIGIGDDLSLPERMAARTPMQWSADQHGGFTTAAKPLRPVVSDPVFGYHRVNVEAQRRDPDSLLNWTERAIRMRKECPEISWGDWRILPTQADEVLVMRYIWQDHALVVVHNFSDKPRAIELKADAVGDRLMVNLLTQEDSRADRRGRHQIELDAYHYRWYRVGGLGHTVPR